MTIKSILAEFWPNSERLLLEIWWKSLSVSFSPGNFLRRVIQFKFPKVFNPQLVFTPQPILRLLLIKLQNVLTLSRAFLDGDSQALKGFIPHILSSSPNWFDVIQRRGVTEVLGGFAERHLQNQHRLQCADLCKRNVFYWGFRFT